MDAIDGSINRETRTGYDALPYGFNAYPHSAPEQLAVVASLFGVPAPAVETARVLELGAASGGNLIPFALRHPRASAVGVDLSPVQIAAGRDYAARIGADNIRLIEGDVLELQAGQLGQFDYIVAHGLYSWVPPPVREAMLELVRRCLAPDGVAYVSYNTYPGWKSKEILREALRLHAGEHADMAERVARGRAMLDFLHMAARRGGIADAAVQQGIASLREAPAYYLAHEYLEPHNLPCFFHQFVEAAGRHGLAYLGESQVSMMLPANYGEEVAQWLHGALGDDRLRLEQYLDFAANRAFRQTLLVHAQRAGGISWKPDRKAMANMHFAAHLACVDPALRLDGSPQQFATPVGQRFATGLSGVKQALTLLTRAWPGTVSRAELVEEAARAQASARDRVASDVLERAIDELLETLVMRGAARVRLTPVALASSLGRAPVVDAGVRRMVAALPGGARHLANFWHDMVQLTGLERELIPLLDGSVDRAAAITLANGAIAEGRVAQSPGKSAAAMVDEFLQRLVHLAIVSRP